MYTRRVGNEGDGKLKGSKETLLGVRGKGREEKAREQIGGGGTKVKASASNSVFTGRDRKTVEIVVATLAVPLVPQLCVHLHTSSTDLRFEFFNSYC